METLIVLTLAALNFPATIYGFRGAGKDFGYERNCGDIGKAVPCDKNAVTASGEFFNPNEITAAVPAPKNRKMRVFTIHIKTYRGTCIPLKINDKKNPRYIGQGGLDLTPAAVWAITGKLPNRYWSGKIELCRPSEVINVRIRSNYVPQ